MKCFPRAMFAAAIAVLLPCVVAACSATRNAPSVLARTVRPSEVASFDFSPSPVEVKRGDAKQLRLIATMGDGTKRDITAEVQWASENPNTATVDAHGTVVGAGAGKTTIIATYADAAGSVNVTVAP